MWIDDEVLVRSDQAVVSEAFIVGKPLVVLGAANKPELEVNLEVCHKQNVEVSKRYGGGGTVVLYDGCVGARAGLWVKDKFKNDFYFEKINDSLIQTIQNSFRGLPELSQRGISDLCVGEQKFCGTSMFRSRNYLLFQASIIVDLDLELVSSLLAHPSKEPDYRKGRSHKDFLTSLSQFTEMSPAELRDILNGNWGANLRQSMVSELIEPVSAQIPHLLKRANSTQGG